MYVPCPSWKQIIRHSLLKINSRRRETHVLRKNADMQIIDRQFVDFTRTRLAAARGDKLPPKELNDSHHKIS
jgi:hypothetical protein